jgi:hypothetical protein
VCVLTLFSAGKQEPEAALALARWDELQHAGQHEKRERRFRRRAFERARDCALQALAMRLKPSILARKPPTPAEGARRSGDGARSRHPARRRRRLAHRVRA